jgi:predicted DNA-binding protein
MFKLDKDITTYENKSLRLPTTLIDKIQNLSKEHDISFNRIVIQCIEYALNNMQDESTENKNGN